MDAVYRWPEAQISDEDAARVCGWYESIDEYASGPAFVTARQVPDGHGAVLVRVAYMARDNGRHYVADIAILSDGDLQLWAN